MNIKWLLSRGFSINILSFLLGLVVRFVYLFSSIEYRNVQEVRKYVRGGKPIILVFWHNRSFLVPKFWGKFLGFRKCPVYGIFSNHRDGRLIGNVFDSLGVKNLISSSKSVLQARDVVMKSIKSLKKGASLGFTPDGPVGPRMHFVSDSAFIFAKLSGAPIVPIFVSSEEPILLNSWDVYMLPKIFHKSVVEVGDMFFVDRKISDEELKKLKVDLYNYMVEKTLKLDREMKMPLILPEDLNSKK